MSCLLRGLSLCSVLLVAACTRAPLLTISPSLEICSQRWFHHVEAQVGTGDGHGHGPDIGSMEWKSVIEFKLGVRGRVQVPEPGTLAWCEYIDALL